MEQETNEEGFKEDVKHFFQKNGDNVLSKEQCRYLWNNYGVKPSNANFIKLIKQVQPEFTFVDDTGFGMKVYEHTSEVFVF